MTLHIERQQRAWMAQWRAAGPVLEQIRLQELAVADMGRIASALEDACLAAVRGRELTQRSGLVEQQRILHSRRVA